MATVLALAPRPPRAVARRAPLPRSWSDVRRYLPGEEHRTLRLVDIEGSTALLESCDGYEILIDARAAATTRTVRVSFSNPRGVYGRECVALLRVLPHVADWQLEDVRDGEHVWSGLVVAELVVAEATRLVVAM